MTSGPQGPQHDRYQAAGPGQAPYGQPPYGQQGWPAFPSTPGYGGMPGAAAAPTPRPTTVTAGIAAFLLNSVLGVLGSIISLVNLDTLLDQAARDAGVDLDQLAGFVRFFAIIGASVGLLFVAVSLVMIWFAWRGQNWARIVLWVLGGLGLLGVLGLFSGLSNPIPALDVLQVLQWLLLVAGIVLLALKPSNEWFRAEGQRRKAFPG